MIPPHLLPHTSAIAMANPFASVDVLVASWFHAHLTKTFATIFQLLSEPGSEWWIGIVLFFAVAFFIFRRRWPALATLIVAVPGGMLLNELIKILVHRHRPFVDGPFVDWSGYSFASGHAIGATLLYGQLLLFLLPAIKSRRYQGLTILAAAALVFLVGFSRIALGAHYLTDVASAIVFGIFWLALCLVAGRPMRRRAQVVLVAPSTAPAVVASSRAND